MSLWYQCVRNLCRSYFNLCYDVRVSGLEHVPPEGTAFILASNHVSYYDPPLIGCQIPHDTHYLARKTLFQSALMSRLLPSIHAVPVDQEKPDMNGLKNIIHHLRQGHPVLLFPEGSRSYDGQLQPGMPGVGLLVYKTGVPVIPVRLFGVLESWPRDGRIQLFRRMNVVFGPALAPSSSKDYHGITQSIMQAIAQLQPPSC
ncbi:MAG: 1-acyl-sn-glycerol-3-phosphate acyltransferase [Blastochloris sp.]|nr:1-acyl-sn-glycerol-3-phosphate acyltransferase [Blastochloris sp.]